MPATAELDVDAGQPQRVAQRDPVGGALGGLDAGEPRDAEHVALADRAGARSAAAVAGAIVIAPLAIATRAVSGFAPTSTMWAAPASSKWVSFGACGTHSTVTDFARLRGWSTSVPLKSAT